MFYEPRVNVIESDKGFSVEVLGRTGLLYREGSKVMRIDSEVLNSTTIAVIKESVRGWDIPHEHEVIDDGERNRIMDNIIQAFDFKLVKIEVD